MKSTAKHFPLRHISIRVPWHDNGWNGTVCLHPARNTSCLKLKNIFESKDEKAEELIAGKSLKSLDQNGYPPCVTERGTLMADFAFTRLHDHPYKLRGTSTHEHFKPTPLHYPAYSAAGLPFRWMMKKFVFGDSKKGEVGLVEQFPLQDVSEDLEPTEDELGFESNWFQDYRNHRMLLDCFWNHVRTEESLVFFYAKQVPLVEDIGKRIIIGVGRVTSIGDLTEYEYDGKPGKKLRSLLWERMIGHSIRLDLADGFLMPYHEAVEKSDDGRAFDPAEAVAFTPDDRFVEFSYASEHVSHDAAISALLACRTALLRSAELFNVSISKQEKWIDREIGRLWKKRGPFPGMGSVLSAAGIPMGNFIAQSLTEKVGDGGNPWTAWDSALLDPAKHLPKELSAHIDATMVKSWKRLDKDRRGFLELLSRIDLSHEQAEFVAVPEVRAEGGIDQPDKAFIENPYLVFEATRLTTMPVAIGTVDRGLLPTNLIREKFPIPEPTNVKSAVDARRLRALTIRELENAAEDGDTLRCRDDIIVKLRKRDNDEKEEPTNVTADLLTVAEVEGFSGEIRLVPMADERVAYQLERFAEAGELIRTTITKRVQAKRHELKVDWQAELDKLLGTLPKSVEEKELEVRARKEKAAALSEIAASRFSVLIGPAGTGKTTLLSVLCRRPEIHKDKILLLAPTGKARVRMEAVAKQAASKNYKAFTIAQFLSPSGRYDGNTQRYLLTGEEGEKVARTVIVDECSMLTEEMMAALLEALSGVHRLIFVGDFRQLPPIGAGRPFADIIKYLAPSDIETRFPRIGTGYSELTVPRRQKSEELVDVGELAGEYDDLQLAAWFGGGATAPGEDQVFEILAGIRKSDRIQFNRWETPDELEELLPKTISDTLGFNPDLDANQAFALSLGGQEFGGYVYFNRGRSGAKAEAWQILSPVRQKPWGAESINRHIHVHYQSKQIEEARKTVPYWERRFLKPCGEHQIVYGDKVINNKNQFVYKSRIYPSPSENGYLANGEIGMVVGQMRTRKFPHPPKSLEIEFSTQQGTAFKFYPSDFSEEREAGLELAYALTIHRAQGSEFEMVFLVLPRSPLMLTRELLYTALTRQKRGIVILHQGDATELHKLSSERHSATATRLTNLFAPPNPVKVGDVFLEERLIHRTARGEAVRSKSEVIVADHLHTNKLNYHYEQPLTFDGVTKYPDFTIEDDDSGITYYWEHCGMLADPGYRKRWLKKQDWYRGNDVLPYQQGGGPKGTLIVTEDTSQGGISSKDILKIVRTVILQQKQDD